MPQDEWAVDPSRQEWGTFLYNTTQYSPEPTALAAAIADGALSYAELLGLMPARDLSTEVGYQFVQWFGTDALPSLAASSRTSSSGVFSQPISVEMLQGFAEAIEPGLWAVLKPWMSAVNDLTSADIQIEPMWEEGEYGLYTGELVSGQAITISSDEIQQMLEEVRQQGSTEFADAVHAAYTGMWNGDSDAEPPANGSHYDDVFRSWWTETGYSTGTTTSLEIPNKLRLIEDVWHPNGTTNREYTGDTYIGRLFDRRLITHLIGTDLAVADQMRVPTSYVDGEELLFPDNEGQIDARNVELSYTKYLISLLDSYMFQRLKGVASDHDSTDGPTLLELIPDISDKLTGGTPEQAEAVEQALERFIGGGSLPLDALEALAADSGIETLGRVATQVSTSSDPTKRIVIQGTEANDTLDESSNDHPAGLELLGLNGKDTLIGSNQDDIINGGDRKDKLTGKAGADQFLISISTVKKSKKNADLIMDFNSSEGDSLHIEATSDLLRNSVTGELRISTIERRKGSKKLIKQALATTSNLVYIQDSGQLILNANLDAPGCVDGSKKPLFVATIPLDSANASALSSAIELIQIGAL
ncbi:calcium-binding protein [Vulcanococcus sp. Clear-D1]|uniref:calcium-binding protein n=1 Tax=Vulcanococcus sp. Clear-D1 TaxID=2766970 RepID=UPI0019B1499C|nr:calcium-binding protein [Vulcanococcus sp. Clear-D1]MBD1193244.1 calcium-binding protein [Vulcanococcus sp. Clear-D1]